MGQRLILPTLFTVIFGEEVSARTAVLLRHIKTITVGTAIAGLLLYLSTIYAAREIGPASYGVYTIALSVSSFFFIPMLCGIHTSTTYLIARTRRSSQRKTIAGTALTLSLFTVGTSAIILWIFGEPLLRFFSIHPSILLPAIAISAAMTYYFIVDSLFRARLATRVLAVLRIVQAALFAVFVFFLLIIRPGARVLLLATFAGAVGFALLGVWRYRTYIGKPAFSAVRPLLHYGWYSMVGNLAAALSATVDKMFLLSFAGESAVGIYAAYLFLSVTLVGKGVGLFLTVLFPFSAQLRSPGTIMRKYNRIILRASILLTIAIGGLLWLLLHLYGERYPIQPHLVMLFSLAAGLYFFVWGRCLLIAAAGVAGARAVAYAALLFSVVQIVLDAILIPQLSITGAVLGLIGGLLILGVRTNRLQQQFFFAADRVH